jgi:hypothetical protein
MQIRLLINQSDAILQPLLFRLSILSLSLHASIVSVHARPRLYFATVKLLIKLFNVMRIRIKLPKIMLIHTDPDPQPWISDLLFTLNAGKLKNRQTMMIKGISGPV